MDNNNNDIIMGRQINTQSVDIPSWLGWGVMFLVFSIPFASGLPLEKFTGAKRPINITLFASLLYLFSLLFVYTTWRQKKIVSLISESAKIFLPSILLLLFIIASGAWTDFSIKNSRPLFAKTIIQLAGYLILAPVIFKAVLLSEKWRGRALLSFSLSVAVAIFACVADYLFFEKASPVFYGGVLLNANVYAMFLCLGLPVLLATVVKKITENYSLPLCILITLMAIYPVQNGALLLAVIISSAIIIGMAFKRYVALVFIVICMFFSVNFGSFDRMLDSVQVYVNYTDPDTGEFSRKHTMRYYRWSANIEMLRNNPLKGVGAGQYQRHIKKYYSGISIPEGRTDKPGTFNIMTSEPMSFGWFFIILCELGIAGFALLMFMLLDLGRQAAMSFCNSGRELKTTTSNIYCWAVLSSLSALLIAGWFTTIFTRGCGGAFAFLLALGVCLHCHKN
jgi:hypothetical protein